MAAAFDIRNPESVAQQLQEANLTLGREPEAPGWMASMIRELSEDIASATAEELEVTPEQWMGVQSAVLRAQSVLLDDIDERTQRRRLRLIIEELRFRLVRLAERQVVDEDRPIKEIAAWFENAVPVSHGAVRGDRTHLGALGFRSGDDRAFRAISDDPAAARTLDQRVASHPDCFGRAALGADAVRRPRRSKAARCASERRHRGDPPRVRARCIRPIWGCRLSYRAVAFRAADYETPLWSFANITAARYNRADREPATQYLSFHPMTPWAELIRNLDLRDPDGARQLRLPIWTIRLELADEPFELT